MSGFQKDVEVIAVGHAIASLDGSELYQVAFGQIGKPSTAAANPTLPPNAKIGAIWVVVFIPKGKPLPYAVGSRWRLTVEGDGRLSLEPIRARQGARKSK
jgi:hypothetical protein